MEDNSPTIRIGVDVGGTNTDAVAMDFSPESKLDLLASCKTPTTPDVTVGITKAVQSVVRSANLKASQIAGVTIGTTHFINAIIERDVRRLRRVAIIRVSKSFLREIPPFAEWPADLARILKGYVGYVDGGLNIDGSEEACICEEQVLEEARIIKDLGLTAVVVAGVFSPIDEFFRQEDRIRNLILREIPGVDVVCSHTVASIGFMERENASILNAAILKYARRTIGGFKRAIRLLGLSCPLFITQNDGTVLDASAAANMPIRTFLSGPTNSMRGAAYLSGMSLESQSIVVDIGGTTTDIGVLLPSGIPRPASAFAKVAGVRVNYTMPFLQSIGLGGGSVIRYTDGRLLIGPESVGNNLNVEALVFGGNKTTTTDLIVAAGLTNIGDSSKVSHLKQAFIEPAQAKIKQILEAAIDMVRLSPEPLPVLLVGGGALLAPKSLKGASSIVLPNFYNIANAVGAATSRVSGFVDVIQGTLDQTTAQAVEYAKHLAISRAKNAGALDGSIQIAEVESIPVSYIQNRIRTIVRAIGDIDINSRISNASWDDGFEDEHEEDEHYSSKGPTDATTDAIDPLTYHPKIVLNDDGGAEWIVSEADIAFLADGCYVLGCAGGGSPAARKIQLTNMLREGYTMRIVDQSTLKDDDLIYMGGGLGSPAVGAERLQSTETVGAVKVLKDYLHHDKFQAVMAVEIGGANGLEPLLLGSSRFFNVPVVDADWMGRAYPTAWQTTLAAHEPGQLVPCAIDSGTGNTIIMTKSSSDEMVDRILRAACVEMGSAVGAATRPTNGKYVRKFGVLNTCSLAWRIGRCIARCQATNNISGVAESIIKEAGGAGTAKVLFRGKIVEVENELSKGHSYGAVHIRAFEEDDEPSFSGNRAIPVASGGTLRIPFKNENIFAEHITDDGETSIIASVPDLIAVIDNESGKAIGVPEFKYGYRVTVIGITCSPRWTDTDRALEIGGPTAFGFNINYKPIGLYIEPKSVIEEFKPQPAI